MSEAGKPVRPWNLIDGSPRSPKEVQEERLATCLKCEHLKMPLARCKICGCFMEQKVKLEHAACPIGKW